MHRTITETLVFSAEATTDIRAQVITVRDNSNGSRIEFELKELPVEQVAYAVRSYINGLRWTYTDNDADRLANLQRAQSILECAQRTVEHLAPKSEEVAA
jgi:hypothetical protein